MDRHELKAHRKRLGLSLADAAAQVHVSPRTWANWESGDRHMPEGVVHLFCILNKIKYRKP
jgi:DNA-binding XRE family transcriptional regulator